PSPEALARPLPGPQLSAPRPSPRPGRTHKRKLIVYPQREGPLAPRAQDGARSGAETQRTVLSSRRAEAPAAAARAGCRVGASQCKPLRPPRPPPPPRRPETRNQRNLASESVVSPTSRTRSGGAPFRPALSHGSANQRPPGPDFLLPERASVFNEDNRLAPGDLTDSKCATGTNGNHWEAGPATRSRYNRAARARASLPARAPALAMAASCLVSTSITRLLRPAQSCRLRHHPFHFSAFR
ncbi:hypothetical protein J0S82_001016, partial [Galemys pyrenaicus]